MRTRLVSTLLALPIAVAALWAGGAVLAVLAAVLAVGGGREARRLLEAGGESPLPVLPEVAGLGLLFSVSYGEERLWPLLLLLVLAGGILRSSDTAFSAVRSNLFLALYPAGFLGFVLLFRIKYGATFTLVTLAAVWGNDISAYIGGRAYGRHRLTALSPGKTWEGTATGLLGAEAVWLAGSWWQALSPGWGAVLGFVTFVGALVGDLLESAFKRWAGSKDSGSFLPGHGGFLDRLDSVLLAVPLVYYVLTALGR